MYDEIEDDRGYRYFINRDGNKMKECPLLINIIKKIKADYGSIKYNTYRCVLKTQSLKIFLSTYCISYRVVVSIVQKHKSEASSQQITPRELTAIVSDIFFAMEKAGLYEDNKNFRLETAVSILTNFLWNVYDTKRTQNLSMMEFKLAMLILCELDPLNTFHQIIESHFEIVKDFNHCITKNRFEEFISIYSKILTYLGEPLYFDQKVISDILSEAFAQSPGFNGINQYSFYNLWTNHQNPKFSTYTNLFLLMIRFKKSQNVIHQNAICTGCKKFPIVGLRYKCQKCKGLSLCFDCFGKGFTNKRHSRGHRFYELATAEVEERKWYSVIFRKVFNVFKSDSSSSIHVNTAESENKRHDNTKLIEDEHIELMQIDDDMEIHGGNRQRRGTIRSEIFNNTENVLIIQKNLNEKLLTTIQAIKNETESFQKMTLEEQVKNNQFGTFLKNHGLFLCDHIEVLKQIYEATSQSLSSTQNNKTIKSFTSPSKSIFLPSSTPYAQKEKPKLMVDPMLCKSINGYELNKSYVAKNEEYSISDLSTFFQTKVPMKDNETIRAKNDETDTKIDNFKHLLKQVKEIIDDSFCDNLELARTTEMFSKALDQIIEIEEKKREHN
ncbi:hypothetical protein PVAND_005708 [Polypedilum vanderplanki]|uniref:ZZ-type domain-containing protein n=1 Tax=Polypedilum vanderplanki TaxID=319348 RepID=A0A9J6C2V6_POLVA|nr:hypothetical protein PVAND_005708 [Polypedilum vanderplanki]